jgi:phage shock protein C
MEPKSKSKKLYRSEKNKVVGGVLGGVSEYFEVDPVLIRILAVIIAVVTGFVPFALIYLLSVVAIPKREHMHAEDEHNE